MTLKNEIANVAQHAAQVPAAVALFLAALFVGVTLFIAFWRKRKAQRIRRRAKRRHKWQWGFFWGAVLFIGFGAYFLFLGFDDR